MAGVRHGWVRQEGGGYDYIKATGGTLVLIELFSILITLCMWENCIELNTHSTHITEYKQNWWNLNKTGGLYQRKYPGYDIVIIIFQDVSTGANWTKGSPNLYMWQLYMNLQLAQLKFQLKNWACFQKSPNMKWYRPKRYSCEYERYREKQIKYF